MSEDRLGGRDLFGKLAQDEDGDELLAETDFVMDT